MKVETKRAEKLATTLLQTSVLLVDRRCDRRQKQNKHKMEIMMMPRFWKVPPQGERTIVSRFGGFPLNNRMTENSDALSPSDNRMRGWATAKKENYWQDILLRIVVNGYYLKMPTI